MRRGPLVSTIAVEPSDAAANWPVAVMAAEPIGVLAEITTTIAVPTTRIRLGHQRDVPTPMRYCTIPSAMYRGRHSRYPVSEIAPGMLKHINETTVKVSPHSRAVRCSRRSRSLMISSIVRNADTSRPTTGGTSPRASGSSSEVISHQRGVFNALPHSKWSRGALAPGRPCIGVVTEVAAPACS